MALQQYLYPWVQVLALVLALELAIELELALVLAIGKELQLQLALVTELELVLVLRKEIVLGKDYLVQCPHHLNRASTRARASARERLFGSVSPTIQKS